MTTKTIHGALLVSISLVLSQGLIACKPADDDEQTASVAAVAATAAPCSNCGEIESITPRSAKGDPRPAAAIAGAVIGGIVGHQFGSGSGNDAATAAGAIGGAVAGSEIDRNRNSKNWYDVVIRMDDGKRITLSKASIAGLGVGDEVKVQGENLLPKS